MENRLTELTEKLRKEGLERGQNEAQEVVAKAKAEAQRIVEEAKAEAQKITSQAQSDAEQLSKNTASEVKMASQQVLGALRTQIETMVTAAVVEPKVSEVWSNGSAVKELIVEAIKSWNPEQEGGVQVVVPEAMLSDVQGAVAQYLAAGVEVVSNTKVKVPFRLSPKEGGYYVDFSDEAFTELLKGTMRAKVAELLF